MTRLVFRDFDQFEDALQGYDGRYLLTRPAECDWRLCMVDLGGVTLISGQDGAANLFQGCCPDGYHTLFVPLAAAASLTVDGVSQERGSATWLAPGNEFLMRARGPTRWLAVMIDARARSDFGEISGEGRSQLWPTATHAGHLSPVQLAEFVGLSQQILHSDASVLPTASESIPQLRDRMRSLVIGYIDRLPSCVEERAARSVHAGIARRARAYILEHLSDPIALDDIAAAARASRRTLYRAFAEIFDDTPQDFVRRLRLHRIRHDLAGDAERACTIALVANRWGMSELGRMSGLYRELFGERPSDTVQRSRRAEHAQSVPPA